MVAGRQTEPARPVHPHSGWRDGRYVPPAPGKQTFCLNTIVKNEAPVIRRCLESVRSLVYSLLHQELAVWEAWLIADGSAPHPAVELPDCPLRGSAGGNGGEGAGVTDPGYRSANFF